MSLITNPTYAQLQSTIADHLHRADLTSVIPDFIGIAEQRMSSDLKARDMETKTTLTATIGVGTIAAPTDLVETRRIVLTSSPYSVVSYAPPEKISNTYIPTLTGIPVEFTVTGGNFEFGPIPDAAYTMELTYSQRIPALSASNTTNWVLMKWPYLYLYGALLASAPYMRDDNRIPVWQNIYAEMVDNVNSVDWYSGASMKVRNG
jgi:hypothetical protein